MQETSKGYCIINIGHPRTVSEYIVNDSFRYYKRDAIKDFIYKSGMPWKYWKNKFNFRCVRCTITIKTEE